MPEPTSTTASVVPLTTMAAATPVLHVAGVSLGLRPDVLLAGFAGAVAHQRFTPRLLLRMVLAGNDRR